jgi:hypothetical protein
MPMIPTEIALCIRATAAGRFNPEIGGTSELDCLQAPRGTFTPIAGANKTKDCAAGAMISFILN